MEGNVVAMKPSNSEIWILASILCLVWVNINTVCAQPPVTSVQEVLKHIKPAGGSCTQQEANQPKLSKVVDVVEIKPDLSCAITPLELLHQLQSPSTVLIDTRSAAEFANYHIDGAMNINATDLRSKAFLREKSVVLIGNGKAEREHYIVCKRLKLDGFKQVRVLQGGLPTWLASGQVVLGPVPNTAQLMKLTPSELWIENRFEANLILVAADQEVLQKQLAGSLLIPDEKSKTIQLAIKQRSKSSKYGSPIAVVVITAKDFDFQSVSEAIKPVPLLIYSETADAFANQLKQQKSVWEAQTRGPKQPSGCGH